MNTKKKAVLTVRGEERRLVWECINKALDKVQEWADEDWEQEFTESVYVEYAIYDHAVYTTLSREGQGLEFAIFENGMMGVRLQEMCHKNRIFELVAEDEVPDVDWDRLEEDVAILLLGFFFGNWHEIMDYIGDSLEWQECFKSYFEENEVFPRGGSTTYIM